MVRACMHACVCLLIAYNRARWLTLTSTCMLHVPTLGDMPWAPATGAQSNHVRSKERAVGPLHGYFQHYRTSTETTVSLSSFVDYS